MYNEKAYLIDRLPDYTEWKAIEKYAKEHRIPIMEPDSIHFLCQLLSIHKPKKILEIGTAIGYSALRMAQVLPESQIKTIERNAELVHIALKHIQDKNAEDQIEVFLGEAESILTDLRQYGEKFDFIFIDAAKGQYEYFFKQSEALLKKSGLIICDNVLFRGFVSNPEKAATKRLKKLALKIRSFNDWLLNNDEYCTSIVPIGDGIAISIKQT